MPGRKRSVHGGYYSQWVGAEVMGMAGFLLLLPSLPFAAASYELVTPPEHPRRTGLHLSLHDHAAPIQRRRSLLASNDGATLPLAFLGRSQGSTAASRVYHVVDYGADPTGRNDSSDAISRAISDAFQPPKTGRTLLSGIPDLGGAEVHLDGGTYLVGRPIRLPSSGGGNFKMHGGTLVADDDFPTDGYLIELWAASSSSGGGAAAAGSSGDLHYEYVTVRGLMLDANYRGGGIAIIDSLRTTVDNCYIAHFATDGVLVRGGHETYVRNSFIGQHITAGADPGEKNFTGVGINLDGNDNAVTDVTIFSAATGVAVSGQANILSGVHCYNKATGWGGIGIHLRLPGLTQTRIVNCYLDYTGILAEDPVQLLVANSFFLGDANVVLKSVKGVMRGVTIVDNLFSGNDKEVDIVQLDESSGKVFGDVDGVLVNRNVVRGMRERATVARGSARGNGTTWAVDFSPVLLFPDRIDYVQYTLRPHGGAAGGLLFQGHALRNVSSNRVVVESRSPISATVHVAVDQSVAAAA
ncbi:hypothetical protein Taro_043413 [Colocasia esculenta]|uniref:Polygalacturonase QRT3 n=1 Tax=Colocasia esculenta TaxID=4460 RepID=A0A843X432_COLES|nr:hypothetical protein [Colocasia esculenta]